VKIKQDFFVIRKWLTSLMVLAAEVSLSHASVLNVKRLRGGG